MDKRIYVTDENGNEIEMTILFTFENEGNTYAALQPKGDDETVLAFKVINDNELVPVEDEDEIEMISEVLEAFEGEENEEA